jgi:hypothetical protein
VSDRRLSDCVIGRSEREADNSAARDIYISLLKVAVRSAAIFTVASVTYFICAVLLQYFVDISKCCF